ncbi:MAG: hypothetical protein Q4D13_05585 [Erysipelotrichaceae bacterium]|nr:hypothetical protein [Erysipelotrichaceae bacterium]
MKLNPPKKLTVIIAAVLAVVALVCRFIPSVSNDVALVSALVSAVLMIASVYVPGL